MSRKTRSLTEPRRGTLVGSWVWAPLAPPSAWLTRCRVLARLGFWVELHPPSEPDLWAHVATLLPADAPAVPVRWANTPAESVRLNPDFYRLAEDEPG